MDRSDVLLLISVCSPLNGDRHYRSFAFDKEYESTISLEALAETPNWKEDEENPPLSARRAIKIADSRQKELVKDSDDYKWHCKRASVIFESTGACYWQIHYEARFRGPSMRTPNFLDLYVQMDGKLIEPEVFDKKR